MIKALLYPVLCTARYQVQARQRTRMMVMNPSNTKRWVARTLAVFPRVFMSFLLGLLSAIPGLDRCSDRSDRVVVQCPPTRTAYSTNRTPLPPATRIASTVSLCPTLQHGMSDPMWPKKLHICLKYHNLPLHTSQARSRLKHRLPHVLLAHTKIGTTLAPMRAVSMRTQIRTSRGSISARTVD